jgi:cell division protein FtsI (penicillin-binding protein 3)
LKWTGQTTKPWWKLAGRYSISGFTISDTHNYGMLTVEGVIQKSTSDYVERCTKMGPHEMWDTYTALGVRAKPQIQFPGAVTVGFGLGKPWRPVEGKPLV